MSIIIKISTKLEVHPDHPDYNDFMLYLPEALTKALCIDNECVETDELYDEDVAVKVLKTQRTKSI